MIFLVLVIVGSVVCGERYNATSTELPGIGICPSTQELRKTIERDIDLLINNSIVPRLFPAHGSCGCGGPGWRRVAYLNMSDTTQTCPSAWQLFTSPRRSCGRPSTAGEAECYSATFPTQGIQYSQVCGRIIGFQVGEPQAFLQNYHYGPLTIDTSYVDGVSLTYGNPRQHIWTFAAALDEGVSSGNFDSSTDRRSTDIPSFVGNDYFCETGVPSGQRYDSSTFYVDDPLWDGQGCDPSSICCTFNNPPWFCKQLPQSNDASLEMRLCSAYLPRYENTPIELIDIYVQ